MTGSVGEQPQPATQEGKHGRGKHIPHPSSALLVFGYLVVAIAGLIVLRATIARLDFIGIGWLIGLAVIPLLPWALPRFGGFMQTMSRYVRKVSVGSVQIDLRGVVNAPIVVDSGAGADVAGGVAALSSSTQVIPFVAALRSLRIRGGAPCGIVDLQKGKKWRLPNLYWLSVVLQVDPVVGMIFFTEMRGEMDGYFVRMSSPREFRKNIEGALPAYRAAISTVQLPERGDVSDVNIAPQLETAFRTFRGNLGGDRGNEDDPLMGYVSAKRLNELLLSPPGPVVESPGDTLSGEQLRTVLTAGDRYVATTTNGLLSGLIDRDEVALRVARGVLTRSAAE